jgi:hypothetical protein
VQHIFVALAVCKCTFSTRIDSSLLLAPVPMLVATVQITFRASECSVFLF